MRGFNCGFDGGLVMAIDTTHHVPTVALKTLWHVFAEPVVDFAIDGNVVVVVQANQFAQAQSACQ